MSAINTNFLAPRQTADCIDAEDPHGWGFISLILVVGSLFIRPADLLPQLRDVPVYQFLIVAALVLSYRCIGNQLQQGLLTYRPVTACILLLVVAVALSHLSNGFFWGARASAWMVLKVVALYLLVAGVVNTTQRIETFARWLVIAIATMSCLSLVDYFGWMDLSAFNSVDDRLLVDDESESRLARICGSGIFEDPNDLGLAVVTGLVLNTYFLFKSNQGWPRYVWIAPGVILLGTLSQTFSRGAFLALSATVPAWYYYHRGWLSAVLGSMALVPILSLPFSGRMTEFNSVYEGTGQSRIQIWSESLSAFRSAPWFGIGEGMFSNQFGFVSHNSFLQTYTELGLVGGSLFVASFLTAIVGLLPERGLVDEQNADANRMRGAIFVALVAYTVGILTLSRQFVAPTFLLLGLAVAAHLTKHKAIPRAWQFGSELAIRSILIGVAFLGLIYSFVLLLFRSA